MLPSVSSDQFVRVLLTFDFVKRSHSKISISMSKRGLNRRVIIPLGESKLDHDFVKDNLAMAGISDRRFVEALQKVKK